MLFLYNPISLSTVFGVEVTASDSVELANFPLTYQPINALVNRTVSLLAGETLVMRVSRGQINASSDGNIQGVLMIDAANEYELLIVKAISASQVTLNSTHIRCNGAAIFKTVGEIIEYPKTAGEVRPKPKTYSSINQNNYIVDYDPRLKLKIDLTGASDDTVDIINKLDVLGEFWVIPNPNHKQFNASWAAYSVIAPMGIGMWKGWDGDKGRAIGGAWGKMELLEVPRPQTIRQSNNIVLQFHDTAENFVQSQSRLVEGRERLFFRIDLHEGNTPYFEHDFHAFDNVELITLNGYPVTDRFTRRELAGEGRERLFFNNVLENTGLVEIEVLLND